MTPRHIAVMLLVLAGPSGARADGCKFASDGRKVPEREQRALVEWADGTETLHVAALSDPTTEANVWVVPVRAAATAVRAEPVEEIPAVVYYETLKGQAERQLRAWVAAAAMFDSGGLCCPCFAGGCGGMASKAAVETSRVERLGMVVTVVSADSRTEIEGYLDAQGVKRGAVDLSSLDPYLTQPGYAFVCGWVARRDQPVRATGLKVVFPSPTLWFPLLPTRAYTEPVETVVYTHGFVRPAGGCDLPGLKCEYIYGAVEGMGIEQAFDRDRALKYASYYYSDRLQPMTRVTLTTDPQQWDRDLELVPGTTPVGTVALAVTECSNGLGLLWSALLGAVLGLAIPWLTVRKAERRRGDWLAGALTGAAIALTIWGSALVFGLWRHYRFRGQPKQPARFIVLPALAVVHIGIVALVCHGLIAWITAAG
ncbi:hypothetical protein J8F10_00575 [Gemmata sp. G18]|uniref:DUF2330 domain-containing protein n=1 Tax=Gemmata palustris TaxID=2822762 RepID=A0ABS5BKH0_9BACT|nr:hypothetical protein [Gemmata palustris]MBP3953795.1 hypothetical protein [Gemmata palustris]